jgi:hypothetical protein
MIIDGDSCAMHTNSVSLTIDLDRPFDQFIVHQRLLLDDVSNAEREQRSSSLNPTNL